MKYTVVDTSKMIARKNGEVVPVIGGRDYSEETEETDPRSVTLTVKGGEKEAERVIRDKENRERVRLASIFPVDLHERLEILPSDARLYFEEMARTNGVSDGRIVWSRSDGSLLDLAFVLRFLKESFRLRWPDVARWFAFDAGNGGSPVDADNARKSLAGIPCLYTADLWRDYRISRHIVEKVGFWVSNVG